MLAVIKKIRVNVIKVYFCVFLPFFFIDAVQAKQEHEKPFLANSKRIVTHVVVQKALANATHVLESIDNKYELNYSVFEGLKYKKFFKHSALISCLYNIQSTRSLEPIFLLWHSVGLLISADFLYEYALLIFLIYKDILVSIECSMDSYAAKKLLLTHLLAKIADLYNKIESLPLQEIIMMINLLTKEIPQIVQEHMGEPSVSMYEWIRGHWLTCSVAIVTLLLKIMIIFKEGEPHEHLAIVPHKPSFYGDPVLISAEDIMNEIKSKKTVA